METSETRKKENENQEGPKPSSSKSKALKTTKTVAVVSDESQGSESDDDEPCPSVQSTLRNLNQRQKGRNVATNSRLTPARGQARTPSKQLRYLSFQCKIRNMPHPFLSEAEGLSKN
jgi:hypothetical protein